MIKKEAVEMPKTEPLYVLTTWGLDFCDSYSWESTLKRIYSEGYRAIEAVPIFVYETNRGKFRELLNKVGLELIVQIHTDGGYFDIGGEYVYCKTCKPTNHLESFRNQLKDAIEMNPIHVNIHAGHDSWDHEQSVDFMVKAQEIIHEYGMDGKVSFETHRARLMYNPYSTRQLLKDHRVNGKIGITADLSHWCCVCHVIFDEQNERDVSFWPETLQLVADHTLLIHHRVGYDQGPQISDPRDPNWSIAVDSHLKWWKTIWTSQRQRGCNHYLEMEFGPPPYMPTLPYTNQPVASQWDVNNAMLDIVAKAFDEFHKKT